MADWKKHRRSRKPRINDGEAYSTRGSFLIRSRSWHKCIYLERSRRARARSKVFFERWSFFSSSFFLRCESPFSRRFGSDTVEKVVEAGAWSDSESPIVKAVSAFPVAGKVFSGKIPYGNYVTIEQMSGVGCVESEPRYSAPWYSNIDVALMGIQSTAQFVEKYHHIIGEFTYLFVQLFFFIISMEVCFCRSLLRKGRLERKKEIVQVISV